MFGFSIYLVLVCLYISININCMCAPHVFPPSPSFCPLLFFKKFCVFCLFWIASSEVVNRKQGQREMGMTWSKGPWFELNQRCLVGCAVIIHLQGRFIVSVSIYLFYSNNRCLCHLTICRSAQPSGRGHFMSKQKSI